VSGDLAIKTVPGGLHIVDVNDPSKPTWLGAYETAPRFLPNQLDAEEHISLLSYTPLGSADTLHPERTLDLIDIRNPSTPLFLGRYEAAGAILAFVTHGGVVYALVEGVGLVVIDLSQLAHPTLRGSLALDLGHPSRPPTLAVAGEKVVVAADASEGEWSWDQLQQGRITVVDVRDPGLPVSNGTLDFQGTLQAMALADTAVFLTVDAGYVDGQWQTPQLKVVDISDAAQPRELAHYQLGLKWGGRGLSVRSGTAFVTGGDRMDIWDVSNPESPQRIGLFEQTQGSFDTVEVQADKAFIADARFGLRIVDVSSPSEPRQVGWFPHLTVGDTGVRIIEVHEGFAYIRDGFDQVTDNKYLVLDISDPTRPRPLPWDLIMSTRGGNTSSISIRGKRVYEHRSGGGVANPPYFQIHDLTDPDNPKRLGRYEPPLRSYYNCCGSRLLINGDRAYFWEEYAVGDTSDGVDSTEERNAFHVIDVRDPAVLQLVALYDDEWLNAHPWPDGLPIAPEFSYERDTNGEWLVIDNTVSGELKHLGTYAALAQGVKQSVWGGRYEFRQSRDRLYRYKDGATDQVPAGLSVFDITDPAHPRLVGDYGTFQLSPFELPVSDTFSYTRDEERGWLVTDVSDPAKPAYLGTYAELTSMTSIYGNTEVISHDYAIAYGWPGQLIDISDPGNPRAIAQVPLRPLDHFVGGNLFMTGGISVALVELPSFIKSISRREGMVDLAWEGWGQARLQRSTSLTDPEWQDLIGSENLTEITLPQWNGSEFFRLAKP
jgi:hypothetical protein